MSDEVLCCIDGTQDIRDLDLKEREIHLYLSHKDSCLVDSTFYVMFPPVDQSTCGGQLFIKVLIQVWKSRCGNKS